MGYESLIQPIEPIPIPGFKTVAQVQENIQAMEFLPLSNEQMKKIDQIFERAPVISSHYNKGKRSTRLAGFEPLMEELRALLKSGFGVLADGKAVRQHPITSFLTALGRESMDANAWLSDFRKAVWRT